MTDAERCDREIAEILERPDVASGQAPAWLVTLGVEDWEKERRLIMEQKDTRGQQLRERYMREANGATWMDWIEDLLLRAEARIAELTAEEASRQAAERIVRDLFGYDTPHPKLADAITAAIQAASNAQLERGRQALIRAMEDQVRLAREARERFEAEIEAERERGRDLLKKNDVSYARERQLLVTELLKCTRRSLEINHVAHVREFMSQFRQHIGDTPGFPPQEVLDLRIRLIAEEFAEMLESAGYGFTVHVNRHASEEDQMHFGACSGMRYPKSRNFPEFIRELIDLETLILGTHIACGIDPAEPWARVCAANMAKTLHDGQPVKPDGWTPPDIAGALKEQGWQG